MTQFLSKTVNVSNLGGVDKNNKDGNEELNMDSGRVVFKILGFELLSLSNNCCQVNVLGQVWRGRWDTAQFRLHCWHLKGSMLTYCNKKKKGFE